MDLLKKIVIRMDNSGCFIQSAEINKAGNELVCFFKTFKGTKSRLLITRAFNGGMLLEVQSGGNTSQILTRELRGEDVSCLFSKHARACA